MTDRVTLLAPAKVNLYLAVGARRSDGYHDLVTVFQSLDERAADVVTVSLANELNVVCEPDIGVPSGENLASRAIRALAGVVGRTPAIDVCIEKRIPPAGGLGGASADAAAALVGACTLWGLDVATPEILDLARSLGADVPFFLVGGTALYGGRGDVLMKRLPFVRLPVVLINPGEPVSTPAAYAAFDRLLPQAAPPVERMVSALRAGDVPSIVGSLHNDLTDAACAVAPGTADALRFVRAIPGVSGALVSGSGSTVFAVCADDVTADSVAAQAGDAGWWTLATATGEYGITRWEPQTGPVPFGHSDSQGLSHEGRN
ncbi:MAG: 4-(cytidine 5'-diphospho)-2-C-methyl-D-erythritol kinase [Coriobacteriia bacterium]